MKQLTWTNETPTEDGFYWFQNKTFDACVVQLITNGSQVGIIGLDYWDIGHPYLKGAQWAGPIPEPKEPTHDS